MQETKIAYQGIPGSFSYIAAYEHFGANFNYIGKSRFVDTAFAVENEPDTFGILPIENSLAGSIYEVYDLLLEYNIKVIAERYLKVSHYLLGSIASKKELDSKLSNIKKIYSHPKAIEQCNIFFNKYPHIEKAFFSDTAGAAKFVSESCNPQIAAIASIDAAKLYDLEVLQEKIEDNPSNFTRFLILSKNNKDNKLSNKCSVIFTLPHLPQSLFKAIEVLSNKEINITKIESRPIHGKPFEYVFYVDFEFTDYELATKCVSKFQEKVLNLKILGFYKSGII